MTIKLSTAVRNAMLDAIETAIGTGAIVKLFTGSPPSACSDADTGTVLASFTLASDWAGAASSGSKSLSNMPVDDIAADNGGTAGYYRVYASNGSSCHMQGTVTPTGGGGDMTIDNAVLVAGQKVSITSWALDMAGHA